MLLSLYPKCFEATNRLGSWVLGPLNADDNAAKSEGVAPI